MSSIIIIIILICILGYELITHTPKRSVRRSALIGGGGRGGEGEEWLYPKEECAEECVDWGRGKGRGRGGVAIPQRGVCRGVR